MARKTGTTFEIQVEDFFKVLFAEMGFTIIEIRRQQSGTQNGFDIRVTFLDNDDNERSLFFECKDYETKLEWGDILPKIIQLEASNYAAHGFIALSPKIPVSNINDNILASVRTKFKFPIRIWDTASHIHDMFSIEPTIYKRIYGCDCPSPKERDECIKRTKAIVNSILEEHLILKMTHRIEIEATDKAPREDVVLVTNLDKKPDEVFAIDDADRQKFHQLRCDYKIYLESLADLNNPLRLKILRWQDNLRIKAERLTRKFRDRDHYTPKDFFHDFFDAAEAELLTFYSTEQLDGDKERLLHGVVFELAAECPLDWRKN